MPTATLQQLLDKVVAIVAAAAPTAAVLKHWRYTKTAPELQAAYVGEDGKLHPWVVTAGAVTVKDQGPGWHDDVFEIVVEGYRAVASAEDSELLHQVEAEAVRLALSDETNRLLGNDGTGRLTTPCARRLWDARNFAGQVLCWHAQLVTYAEPLRS
jgi:hypothetical protein